MVLDPSDPLAALYDVDDPDQHMVLLADVWPQTLQQQLAGLEASGMLMGPGGCTYQDVADTSFYAVEVNGESLNTTGAAKVFTVAPGRRYRFRTVCGTSSWGLTLAVRRHNVTLIALDGAAIAPAPAAAVRMTPGERVDFVLAADQPIGNYWIDITTPNGLNSPAILHYDGAPDPATDPAVAPGTAAANLTCAAGLDDRPGVVDLKNASLTAGPGVEAPPKVRVQGGGRDGGARGRAAGGPRWRSGYSRPCPVVVALTPHPPHRTLQKADRSITVYLPSPTLTQLPPEFLTQAAAPGNAYGLDPANVAALSSSGTCPQGLYCWVRWG